MTKLELIDALGPFLQTFGADLADGVWHEYHLALGDVNPGDLDGAMADLRRTHTFRNAPLPAEILDRCQVHRKRRYVNAGHAAPEVQIGKNEGEWKSITIKGIGVLKMRVLPDDHPALPRYSCLKCKDSSWEEIPNMSETPKQPTCRRCSCWSSNPVIAQQRSKDAEFRRGRKAS